MKRRAILARSVHVPATLAAFAVAMVSCGGWAASPVERAAAPAATATRVVGRSAKTISDPAVRPAGGGHCSQCPGGQCHHAPRAGHGHHRECRKGVCVPYCPVRPREFGFYGTRWRKWPGQDVVPVSAERAVTPAVPPRSAVPGADEESMSPQAGDIPLDAADPNAPLGPEFPELPAGPAGSDRSGTGPTAVPPPVPEAEPTRLQRPAGPALPAPGPLVPAEPMVPPPPEPAPPEDENLFEVRSSTRAKRKFAVRGPVRPASPVGEGPGAVQPARHLVPAEALEVPPVPFDAAAETRRLRSVRPDSARGGSRTRTPCGTGT